MSSNPSQHIESDLAVMSGAARLGFWMALLLTVLTLLSFTIGMVTPPRSGAYCSGTCLAYPYADAARFVPRDYLWMLPGTLILPVFVIMAGCADVFVAARRKHLSRIGLCFASISTAIVTIDYFVQYAVVEPSLTHGETSGLALYLLYNPRGIYIALENLGYLMLSAAFLFIGFAIPISSRAGKGIRWTFVASAVLSFVTFNAMAWHFGLNLEFGLELAIISIVWTALIVAGVLFSIFFHRLGWQGRAGHPWTNSI